jgi:hypothetical protein
VGNDAPCRKRPESRPADVGNVRFDRIAFFPAGPSNDHQRRNVLRIWHDARHFASVTQQSAWPGDCRGDGGYGRRLNRFVDPVSVSVFGSGDSCSRFGAPPPSVSVAVCRLPPVRPGVGLNSSDLIFSFPQSQPPHDVSTYTAVGSSSPPLQPLQTAPMSLATRQPLLW